MPPRRQRAGQRSPALLLVVLSSCPPAWTAWRAPAAYRILMNIVRRVLRNDGRTRLLQSVAAPPATAGCRRSRACAGRSRPGSAAPCGGTHSAARARCPARRPAGQMFLVVPGVQVGLGLGQHIGLDDVVPGRVLAAGGARQVQRPVQHAHAGAGQLLGHARAHFGQGAFAAVDVQIGLVLVHGRIGAHAHVGQAVGQPAGDTGGARRADALAQGQQQYGIRHFPIPQCPTRRATRKRDTML